MSITRPLSLEFLESRLLLSSYWVDPLGDDTLDGLTPQTAWASPSRGQSTTISSDYIAGSIFLSLSSTKGFLDSGNLTVAGQTLAYFGKTSSSVTLAQPFNTNFAQHEPVFDADILGGDSFEPGDVINLRGGEYANRPLDFYQSGSAGSPITYRSSPGEQAVLKSELYQCRSGQAPGLLDKHLDAVRDD